MEAIKAPKQMEAPLPEQGENKNCHLNQMSFHDSEVIT